MKSCSPYYFDFAYTGELDITLVRLLKVEQFVVIKGRRSSQEVDRVCSKLDIVIQ